jgi:hypothetical protein
MTASNLFQMRRSGSVGPQSLGKPSAVFPGGVAGDAQLVIAVDRVQTTLAVPLGASDTSMKVASPGGIVIWSLLSIDDEIVQVSNPPSGSVIPISRGFDGTASAQHFAGAAVNGYIDAFHHNTLVAEIEAIETALGANLSKLPTSPFVVSDAFIFPPQAPGGSLVIGANQITLSPVPAGVNGTDATHYLYVSGGTGAAEAALIIGGNAVGGAPSGTLIIQCANTHSGAWTIQTSSAGIQEAISSLHAGGGMVLVPPGTKNVYHAVVVTNLNNIQIIGFGWASNIVPQFTSGDVFYFNGSGGATGYSNALKNLQIGSAAQTINTPNSLVNLHLNGQNDFTLNNVYLHDAQIGIKLDSANTCSTIWVSENLIGGLNPGNGVGILQMAGADLYITNTNILGWTSAAPRAGIEINFSGGTKIIGSDIFACSTNLLIDPANGQTVQAVESIGNWYDSGAFPATGGGDGIALVPTGTGIVMQVRSTADWLQGNIVGLRLGGTGVIDGVTVSQPLIINNKQDGIYYSNTSGKNIEITAAMVAGNSSSASASYNGLTVLAGCGGFKVRGGQFGQSNGMPNSQSYGIFIVGGASDFYQIVGADLRNNVNGTMSDGGAGTHAVVKDNTGFNPVGQGAIAVGASPFTYRSAHGPETIYISGGTVSNIQIGTTTVAVASPAQLALGPNQSITVTYSVAPTMVKDVQ